MIRRFRYAIIGCTLAVSLCTTALAASFPDVDSTTWGWAKSQIEDMSGKGIIAGFPDGTFKPAENVTKLQSLILIARILGVNDSDNTQYVDAAESAYKDSLSSYSISNKREVSYLLYKGFIQDDELDTYVGTQNADAALKRYEAAVLFTKAMGEEQNVKNQSYANLTYSDAASIPAEARNFVAYVRDQNIMQGLSATEFAPIVDVTRAQMAVMLYRVMEKVNNQKVIGTLMQVDSDRNSIKVHDSAGNYPTYKVDDSVILRLDGREEKLSEFEAGTSVTLTLKSDKLYMMEGLSMQLDDTVEGIITSLSITGNPQTITIQKDNGSSQSEKDYTVSKNVVVQYDGESSSLNDLSKGDVVKLGISDGTVVSIEAKDKTETVSGTVEEITIDPKLQLKVKLDNGDTEEYDILDDITVKRNNKNSDLASIMVGDKVDLTLEYSKVSEIEAKSVKSTVNGTIEEIIISKNPSISVRNGDDVKSYSVPRDVDIELNDTPGSIYDLRLGDTAKVNLESNTVVSIEAQKTAETQQITGTVLLVNASYYLLNLATTDAASGDNITQQVFVKKTANIIDSSSGSKTLRISNIEVGNVVTVVGTVDTGVFEASTVIIIK